MRRAGFLLVTGHGVDDALRAGVRTAARRFFALPDEVKQRYAVRIGARGWLAPGVEANALVEGTETPPDLKESFAVGPDTPTGDAAVDAVWFPPNVWPAEGSSATRRIAEARRRSVPDRAAHRLRHGHRARPGAGSGRAAGVRHPQLMTPMVRASGRTPRTTRTR